MKPGMQFTVLINISRVLKGKTSPAHLFNSLGDTFPQFGFAPGKCPCALRNHFLSPGNTTRKETSTQILFVMHLFHFSGLSQRPEREQPLSCKFQLNNSPCVEPTTEHC